MRLLLTQLLVDPQHFVWFFYQGWVVLVHKSENTEKCIKLIDVSDGCSDTFRCSCAYLLQNV